MSKRITDPDYWLNELQKQQSKRGKAGLETQGDTQSNPRREPRGNRRNGKSSSLRQTTCKGFYTNKAMPWTALTNTKTVEGKQLICTPENNTFPAVPLTEHNKLKNQLAVAKAELKLWRPKSATDKERNTPSFQMLKKSIKAELRAAAKKAKSKVKQ